jgi:hypothetical protein
MSALVCVHMPCMDGNICGLSIMACAQGWFGNKSFWHPKYIRQDFKAEVILINKIIISTHNVHTYITLADTGYHFYQNNNVC